MIVDEFRAVWRARALVWVMARREITARNAGSAGGWVWCYAQPLLMVAAFEIMKNPSLALYLVGAAMIILLLTGIRNAWDMVTFLAVERAHSGNRNTE